MVYSKWSCLFISRVSWSILSGPVCLFHVYHGLFQVVMFFLCPVYHAWHNSEAYPRGAAVTPDCHSGGACNDDMRYLREDVLKITKTDNTTK